MKAFLKAGYAESDHTIVERVHEVAGRKGWKMSQVALAWLAPRVSSPIVGCSSVDRLDEALETRDKQLTKEEEKSLEEPYVARDVQGHT